MVSWLAQNWFDLLQTLGIVGGLFHAGASLHFDTKVRKTEINLSLTESHREIWQQMVEQPALSRILDPNADPKEEPIKPEERRFVNLVVMHVIATHNAIKEGVHADLPGLEDDVRALLALPIPREVVRAMLTYQSPEVRSYLQKLL
ncbi:MAG: hypothetical protein KDN05_02895 [Verrucomicrobiae bacterium]|nr:hypothetical protein [Verrucomicrobiae bacterium]